MKPTPFRRPACAPLAFRRPALLLGCALFCHFAGPAAGAAGGPCHWDSNANTSGFGTGNLNLSGGVLGLGTGNFARAIGAGTNQFRLSSASFAAYGGNRTVTAGTLNRGNNVGTNTEGTGGSLTYSPAGTGPRFVRLKVTPN